MNKISEEEYRESSAINYSLLKKVGKNPWEIKEPKDISNNLAVKKGDLLDILITQPEKFEKKYKYYDGKIPTATLYDLAHKTIEYCHSMGEEDVDNNIVLKIIQINKFWSTTKDETKLITKFDCDEFWNYVKFHVRNKDCLMIDKSTYDQIHTAKETILTHEFTKHIFDKTERELVYQEAIFDILPVQMENGETKEFEVKILPDVISIDHENKVVYPYDIKFMEGKSVYGFKNKIFMDGYYIQSGLYTYTLKKWVEKTYPGYRCMYYKFLAISSTNLNLPLLFDTYQVNQSAMQGFNINGIEYKGIYQLIRDLEWHKENDLWEYTRDLYESNGEIIVNL